MNRVSTRSVTQHMQELLANKYSQLTNIQEQLSTGKRLNRPSDSPVDVANDLKLRSTSAILSQNSKNISDGLNFMNVSDTAMTSMDTIIQRMRELAIQGSSDTVSANDRISIQQETQQLFKQLVALTNSNYKGDYIFGGTQSKIQPYPIETSATDTPADYQKLHMAYFNGATLGVGQPAQIRNSFDNTAMTNIIPGSLKIANGATTYVEGKDFTMDYVNGIITPTNAALAVDISDGGTFAGPNYKMGAFSITFERVGQGKDVYGTTVANTGNVLREIEPGIVMPVNITGSELTVNPSTGIDMMSSLIKFNQNLLQNNRQGISSAITDIDSVMQTLLTAQSKNGARVNRFTATQDRNDSQTTETDSLESNLEDVDMADAISKFSLTENVYNAALKAASKTIQPSLTDYL